MARISKYTRDTSLNSKDLLVGSNYISGSLGEEVYETSTFNLGDLKTFILKGVTGEGGIPYTNDDVDTHLNKGPQTQDGYVLSLSNNDYTWVAQSGGVGTVTNIETAAPITGGSITSTGTISISQASTSTDGYLSSTDWNTFNTKQSTSEKGAASGYAPLNANQKVPTDNLPDSIIGAVVYQGTWDAATNTPTLPMPAAGNNGHYYIVSDAGTYSGITYAVGDWAISNGIAWEKVDNTQDVNTVFGRQGNVVADASDYSSFYDANVQSNWDEIDVNSDAFILNKPNIPAGYTDADVDAHLNKTGTTPDNLVLSLSSGDYAWVEQSGGSVDSVNEQTGAVVLDTDDIDEGTTNLYYTEARVSANTDVAANTAKVGITAQQATDITTNNAKVGITTGQAAAIVANTAKVGITTQQASDITANNAKVSMVFGTTAGTALEGDTVIPTNTSDLTNNSGYVTGTTTSQAAITEIKTLTSVEYAAITPDSDIMYVII